jgi:hypothetical protein
MIKRVKSRINETNKINKVFILLAFLSLSLSPSLSRTHTHTHIYTVEPLLSGLRLTVPLPRMQVSLNCAETLLQFLEQESDLNFSDILTICKLRTSVKLKRSKKIKRFHGLFQERFLTAVRTTKGKNSYLYSFLK